MLIPSHIQEVERKATRLFTKEEIEIECDCGKPHCFYIVHAQRYNEGKFEILELKQNKSL